MANFLPLLVLGAGAFFLMKKKGTVTVSDPRVVSFDSKAAFYAHPPLAGVASGRARPFVALGYRPTVKVDPKRAEVNRVRQVFRSLSAEYPQIDFFEYPESISSGLVALGLLTGTRKKDERVELLHFDPNPEGEWVILTTAEAHGDVSRAAQWAAGKIEVDTQIDMTKLAEKVADLGEGMLGVLSGLFGMGGGPRRGETGTVPGARYMTEIMGAGPNWVWKIHDQELKKVVAQGNSSSKEEAQADADAMLAQLRGPVVEPSLEPPEGPEG